MSLRRCPLLPPPLLSPSFGLAPDGYRQLYCSLEVGGGGRLKASRFAHRRPDLDFVQSACRDICTLTQLASRPVCFLSSTGWTAEFIHRGLSFILANHSISNICYWHRSSRVKYAFPKKSRERERERGGRMAETVPRQNFLIQKPLLKTS